MNNDKITGSMSEKLTDTNWPNPERPGYYWLKCRTEAQSELEIFYWDKDAEVFSGIGDVGCVDEGCFADHWEYHGPVLTPTQNREMLAGERVRAEIGNDRIALPTYEVFCNSAKYLMSGEFSIITHIQCCECGGSGIEEENIEDGTDVLCEACAGEGEITVEHLIPWGTIKQIYRSIVSKYGPKPAIDAARNGGE